jgi:ubiquinone/menaquinone biosynthesis C-methylase UbiE
MNSRHSRLTDWGLSHVTVKPEARILDVGCGGGRTVNKLSTLASQGKVFGIDHSDASLFVARKLNARRIQEGRVEVLAASVSQLPFPKDTFDLVTAVETHFWWPDLPAGMREILRILRPGATALIVAEIYKGAQSKTARLAEKLSRMTLLSPDEHRTLLADSGYSDVEIITQPEKGWISAIGKKPAAQEWSGAIDEKADSLAESRESKK